MNLLLDAESSWLTVSFVLTNSSVNVSILITLIILLIFSSFFSMSETVFSSVSEAKVRTLVEDRATGAKKALYCVENFERTLTTLLVGNNIANTAMSVLSVTFFTQLFINRTSEFVSIISTVIITIILLIFGEIFPKTIGKKYNEKLSLVLGPVVWLFGYILYIIVIPFRGLQALVTGRNSESSEQKVDENELGSILDSMEENGSIEPDERILIKNVFDLNDQTVEDIMTPRVDMVALDIDSTIDEAKDLFLKSNFSRIPVYRDDKDHIIGVLYEIDFYSSLINNNKFLIEDIMKPAKFVNKTMTVDRLIKELQLAKMHIAVVSGEYGDTLGIVTMEDALEELVGEIYDEHDEGSIKNKMIVKQEDSSYLLDGELDVDELFDELNIGDCPDEPKLSTWIFESQEELPKPGDRMTYIARYTKVDDEGEYKDFIKKLDFEIVKVDNRRIEKVKLSVSDISDKEKQENLD